MSISIKAALTSSVVFIMLLVSWNYFTTAHRSLVDSLSYMLWVVPLAAIISLVNWIALLSRLVSSSPVVVGATAFVLLFGLTIAFSEAMRSMGGKMTPLQVAVTAAFALFNAACLVSFMVRTRTGA